MADYINHMVTDVYHVLLPMLDPKDVLNLQRKVSTLSKQKAEEKAR